MVSREPESEETVTGGAPDLSQSSATCQRCEVCKALGLPEAHFPPVLSPFLHVRRMACIQPIVTVWVG